MNVGRAITEKPDLYAVAITRVGMMNAYLHINPNTDYPATLITVGMNDPLTVAWEPGKFAAKLQALNSSNRPILFDVGYEKGHGFNGDRWDGLMDRAKIYAFSLWQTGDSNFGLVKD